MTKLISLVLGLLTFFTPLWGSELSGLIPQSLAKLQQLTMLDVSNNKLSQVRFQLVHK